MRKVLESSIEWRCIIPDRVETQTLQRSGERRLAAFAQFVADLHERTAARESGLETAALDLYHHEIFVRLEFIHSISRVSHERARFLE